MLEASVVEGRDELLLHLLHSPTSLIVPPHNKINSRALGNKGLFMVFILDGNSETGAHVRGKLCYFGI